MEQVHITHQRCKTSVRNACFLHSARGVCSRIHYVNTKEDAKTKCKVICTYVNEMCGGTACCAVHPRYTVRTLRVHL